MLLPHNTACPSAASDREMGATHEIHRLSTAPDSRNCQAKSQPCGLRAISEHVPGFRNGRLKQRRRA